jgi:hypothetical protein
MASVQTSFRGFLFLGRAILRLVDKSVNEGRYMFYL